MFLLLTFNRFTLSQYWCKVLQTEHSSMNYAPRCFGLCACFRYDFCLLPFCSDSRLKVLQVWRSTTQNHLTISKIFGNVRPFILHSSVPKSEFAVFPYIVRKRVPTPPFLRQPPLDPPCPPFLKALFLLPSFLFHPLLRHFRQLPPPSRNPLLP